MSVASSKNSVVVGYVAYFVGLSLIGLMIYCWSKPRMEVQHTKGALHSEASSGDKVVVEYQAIEGAEAVAAPAQAEVAPSVPAAPAADPTAPATPAAATEEWN